MSQDRKWEKSKTPGRDWGANERSRTWSVWELVVLYFPNGLGQTRVDSATSTGVGRREDARRGASQAGGDQCSNVARAVAGDTFCGYVHPAGHRTRRPAPCTVGATVPPRQLAPGRLPTHPRPSSISLTLLARSRHTCLSSTLSCSLLFALYAPHSPADPRKTVKTSCSCNTGLQLLSR